MLKNLPSIEKLVESESLKGWKDKLIHSVRVRLAQELVATLRAEAKKGEAVPPVSEVEQRLEGLYEGLLRHRMQKVINATGVVLHTNLGRAPLGSSMLERMARDIDGYCSLEFDLRKGERGSRTGYIERLLSLICGVPASLVVNNNAAATYLLLHTFAAGKEVVISRSELVQIGGGYRVPDILAASGAKLVEVGTTNMTSIKDYEKAVTPNTGMILKVHQSNFFISGHTESPKMSELVALAKKKSVMFAVDLGSGLIQSTDWAREEMTVESVVRSGSALTCFSGDKLLGGPQAGILVGADTLIHKLRKSPLYRALRLGKTELYLLEETLLHYATGIPTPGWEMLDQKKEALTKRCQALIQKLEKTGLKATVCEGTSSVGGGTMPACQLDTALIELHAKDPERFAKSLRKGHPAVVSRLEKKRVLLDLRTVQANEEDTLVDCITKVVQCMS